ncbi:MAG: hypothetical protein Rsou_1440 [Candidatus Ruthia sp. Asou_11_S2]|nr:hypothetical protein [Candidatus Ruthia sp. Asou_11_S2]
MSLVSTLDRPTKGTDLGTPNKPIKTVNPSKPKTIEGTAARLLMLIISTHLLFCGANSYKYTAANTPIGNESNIVTNMTNNDPTTAPLIPACSGSRESLCVKK